MKKIGSLSIRGSHYDIGVALGEVAGTALREIIPGIERYRALERAWLSSDHVATLLAAARAAHPAYVKEIEGIAAGARADFGRVFLWNCRGDLPGGGDQSQPNSLGCTSVMLPPGGSSDADVRLLGHNEDDQFELDGHCHFVAVTLDDGGGFHSFYSPGLLPGHTFAVSHRGLVQTINHVRPHDQKSGVPRHLCTRAVLDCASLDEAIELLGKTPRASGFHHNLAMAGDPRMFSVEAPATGVAVREITTPVVHANHLLRQEFAHVDQTVAPSSATRQRRAEALLEAGHAALTDPLDILGDITDSDLPIYRKARGANDPGYTLATAIFEVNLRAVRYTIYSDQGSAPEHSGTVVPASRQSTG